MAEIETTPDIITGDDIGTNVIDHTIVADSFINVAASDPTVGNDTGSGYVVGSVWVNSSSGQVFQAIDVTAESSVWVNQEGDDINNDPFNGTNYGFSIGGYGPAGGGDLKDIIDRISFSSPHDASDYGEITTAGYKYGSFTDAAKSKGFICGGSTPPGNTPSEVATFNFTGSPIGVVDVGDLLQTNTADPSLQCQTPSLGILGGGVNYPPGGGDNIIDTIQTFSNGTSPFTALDSGAEMATSSGFWDGSVGSDNENSYVYYHNSPSSLERFSMGITTGTATDVGEFSVSKNSSCGSGSDTEWGVAGGGNSNVTSDFHKMSYSSSASASDVGEMQRSMRNGHSCSDNTHMYIMGGHSGYPGNTNPTVDQVDQISWTSPGSSANVGEMVTIAESAIGNSGPS